MASVILRFSKQKGNPATKIEAHHERTKEEYKSNPDIDTSKSKNNIHLIAPQMRYKAEVDKRIYDRVLGMCVPVMFNGVNFRTEEAAAKMEAAKKLFGMEERK